MNEQAEQITRVREAIAQHIAEFINGHINEEFHVEDLRRYVCSRSMVAPASPDRILRDMRQRGRINYEVVSRSKSLYKALPVKGQMELF